MEQSRIDSHRQYLSIKVIEDIEDSKKVTSLSSCKDQPDSVGVMKPVADARRNLSLKNTPKYFLDNHVKERISYEKQ